ncbi:MAG: mycothiol conjugate amidase Mca [Actinomycetota bacterium]
MEEALCLLQIHAHPDDEASKGAGIAARYSAEGARCVLVTCTGGEAGDILNPAADTEEARTDLAKVRQRELEASVEILGYAALHLLGYLDSGMPDTEPNRHPGNLWNADQQEALERLVRIVRSERPQVILTYDDDHSGYPHPDHIRAHELGVAVFEAAGDPARFPEAGDPWTPSKLYYMGWTHRRISALHEAIVASGQESWYAKHLDKWDPSGDAGFKTRIDVRPYLPQRSAALLAHATQVAPDSFWFALPDEVVADVYPFEDYKLAKTRVEPEYDETGFERDLFSGIR